MRPHLIKVSNDLIEKPQTLNPHVVAIQLDVEVIEVGDGSEHDAHLGVGLVIEVLQRQKGSAEPRHARYGQPTGAAFRRGYEPGHRDPVGSTGKVETL